MDSPHRLLCEMAMTRFRACAAFSVVLLIAAVPLITTPAGAQQTDHAKQLGGKLICGVGTTICNCKQILTQCNHVGCMNSAMMLKTLDAKVAKGDSDESILQSFVLEFGTGVLRWWAHAWAWAGPPCFSFSSFSRMPRILRRIGQSSTNCWSAATPFMTICATCDSSIVPENTRKVTSRQ